MSEQEIIYFLETYNNYTDYAHLISWIFRWIGIGLFYLLFGLAELAELIFSVITFSHEIFDHPTFTFIFNAMAGVGLALSVAMTAYVAVTNIFKPGNKKAIKEATIRTLVFAAFIMLLPSGFRIGLNFAFGFSAAGRNLVAVVDEDGQQLSMAMTVVRNNMTDLLFVIEQDYDDNGFALLHDPTSNRNNLRNNTVLGASFNDIITPRDIRESSWLVFWRSNDGIDELYPLQYQLMTDPHGNLGLREIRNGWLSIFDNGYYRWSINWINLYISLAVIIFFFFSNAFILFAAILNLLIVKIISPIVIASDVETGQKTKALLSDAIGGMMQIAFTGINLAVFMIALNWVLSFVPNPDFIVVNSVVLGFARVIMLVVLTGFSQMFMNAIAKYYGGTGGMQFGKSQMAKAFATGMMLSRMKKMGKKPKADNSGGVQDESDKFGDNQSKKAGVADKMKNAVTSVAGKAGQLGTELNELGAGGFVKKKAGDTATGVKDGVKNKVVKPVTDTIGEVKDAFNDGADSGIMNVYDHQKVKREKQEAKEMKANHKNASKRAKQPLRGFGMSQTKEEQLANRERNATKKPMININANKPGSDNALTKFTSSKKDISLGSGMSATLDPEGLTGDTSYIPRSFYNSKMNVAHAKTSEMKSPFKRYEHNKKLRQDEKFRTGVGIKAPRSKPNAAPGYYGPEQREKFKANVKPKPKHVSSFRKSSNNKSGKESVGDNDGS